LREISDKLQQAVSQSSQGQLSAESVRLAKQAQQLTKRINAELKEL